MTLLDVIEDQAQCVIGYLPTNYRMLPTQVANLVGEPVEGDTR